MRRSTQRKLLILYALVLGGTLVYLGIRLPQMKTEDDIREAVFRYEFRHNCSGRQSQACAYYIGMARGWSNQFGEVTNPVLRAAGVEAFGGMADEPSDPKSWLLRRFRGHTPAVKKYSEHEVRDLTDGVQDARSAKPGLVFIVGGIRWIGPDEVEVEGGYYEDGLSSSGSIYRLERRKGKWTVVRETMTWIS